MPMAHEYQASPTIGEIQAAYNSVLWEAGGRGGYEHTLKRFRPRADGDFGERAQRDRYDRILKAMGSRDPTKTLTNEQLQHLASTRPGIVRLGPYGRWEFLAYYECRGKKVAVRALQILVNRKDDIVVCTYDATTYDYGVHAIDVTENWVKINNAKEEVVDTLKPEFDHWNDIQMGLGVPFEDRFFGNFVLRRLGTGFTSR